MKTYKLMSDKLNKLVQDMKKKHGEESNEHHDALSLKKGLMTVYGTQSFPGSVIINNEERRYKNNIYMSYDEDEDRFYLTNDDLQFDDDKFFKFQDKYTFKRYKDAYNALLKLSKK